MNTTTTKPQVDVGRGRTVSESNSSIPSSLETVTQPRKALKGDLDKLVDVICKADESGLEAGRALAEIRDRKLFGSLAPSFKAYVEDVLGYSHTWALNRINAVQLYDRLVEHAKVSGVNPDVIPRHEGHLRPLVKLETEEAISVICDLVQDDSKVTVARVEKAVREHPSQQKGEGDKKKGNTLTTKEKYDRAKATLQVAIEATRELELALKYGAAPDALVEVLNRLREALDTEH